MSRTSSSTQPGDGSLRSSVQVLWLEVHPTEGNKRRKYYAWESPSFLFVVCCLAMRDTIMRIYNESNKVVYMDIDNTSFIYLPMPLKLSVAV